ncbi:hypothetical protein [Candidatus Spongiihabitans sp.]|uniref:hypothetical protein n=1 Tax=Candidatus Spongiihabitans sp. TaxID=3101308 RepID=UPI003C70588A
MPTLRFHGWNAVVFALGAMSAWPSAAKPLSCARAVIRRGGLPQRYPADVKKAIDRGRLLVISPFPDSVQRITVDTARKRDVAR